MLNIIENIDPINFIIQDILSNISGLDLVARNNYFQGEGYALDVVESRKNVMKLTVRTQQLQNLCNIGIDKKNLIIRYSPEFFFVANGEVLTTNLFNDNFTLEEMESVFEMQQRVFSLPVQFDYSIMQETIEMCRRVHSEFLRKITTS